MQYIFRYSRSIHSKTKNPTNSRDFIYFLLYSIQCILLNSELNVNLFHFHNGAQFNQI